MRRRIYNIIEIGSKEDILGTFYDHFMMMVIIISLIPLFFKYENAFLTAIDIGTTVIFILDYLFRWLTADYKFPKYKFFAFLFYPFTLWALFDLLAILPTLSAFNPGLRLFKLFRLLKALKAVRILKYSHSFNLIIQVIVTEKRSLLAVCQLAFGYILISAMLIFSVEPDSFESFFDALYWAVVTLTTVGYGDLYPTTSTGRLISMLSSFMGIAIVALPTGIITAGYTNALKKRDDLLRNSGKIETKDEADNHAKSNDYESA